MALLGSVGMCPVVFTIAATSLTTVVMNSEVMIERVGITNKSMYHEVLEVELLRISLFKTRWMLLEIEISGHETNFVGGRRSTG